MPPSTPPELPQIDDDTVVKFNRLDPPQKTFFYEKRDGTIFAATQNEAWTFGKFHKLIGTSNGRAYHDTVRLGVKPLMTKKQVRELLKQAFDAELAVARGKVERPKSTDVWTAPSVPEDLKQTIIRMGQNGQTN